MKSLCLLLPALVLCAACAAPTASHLTASAVAASSVTVSAPANNASVSSPFRLSANATPCSNQPVASMGYSLDDSSSTVTFNSAEISTSVSAAAGAHILHVKAWGNQGTLCATDDVPITVVAVPASAPTPAPTPTPGPVIPTNAVAVESIQTLQNWQGVYDSGTGSGSSTGTMSLTSSPSVSGTAREFLTTYTNYGGERYWVNFGTDSTSTHFLMDTMIYVASPSTDIGNIELDLNQVIPNGETVIFGFQCDGSSNTWDYTINAGTPQQPVDQWVHSTQTCNPRNWSTGTWHHLQISYSRDTAGNATYESLWFDGAEQDINATVPSAFALGWGPALLANFQVDGATSTSGSSIVYLDKFTVYRW